MSTNLDVHAQLASVIERFAKCALLEMTKIVDNDSALLRAEISRRQMEIESLLCKLQFAESELKSAKQAAVRQSAPKQRSVGIQVCSSFITREKHKDVHLDNTSLSSSNEKEDGLQQFSIKVERTEIQLCNHREEVKENQESWVEERISPNTSGEGCPDSKPSITWGSSSTGATQRLEALQESPHTSQEESNANVSPNLIEDVSVQYHKATESDATTQHRPGWNDNISLMIPPVSERRRVSMGAGKRKSRCPQCGKTFTTRFYLKIHQRIHTGERPYTCLQCGKRFYCNSHLISHQRCHTGEKPYSCEECGKSYSHLNSLKLHQRSHTEEEVSVNYW